MSGGKGGSQTTKVEIPQWLEDAQQTGVQRADQVSKIGYTPYYGPDVAAFAPQQIAAMHGSNQAAAAFGMPTAAVNVPPAQDFGNGIQGYSSGGLYDQALAELKRRNPAQYQAITGMFVGGQPATPVTPGPQPGPQSWQPGGGVPTTPEGQAAFGRYYADLTSENIYGAPSLWGGNR